MKAWHFVGDTLRDRRTIPDDGVPLIYGGPVRMCRSGLHASVGILDALQYAPGSTICRVECRGIEEKQYDKLVCRERTILYRVDGEELLRKFARKCALDVIHLWDAPTVVVEYLKTGDPKKKYAACNAARGAAWDAAWDAAWSAARGAARDAACNAAWDAACNAARGAACNAARSAARGAAWDAARDVQQRRLVAMIAAEKREQYANL